MPVTAAERADAAGGLFGRGRYLLTLMSNGIIVSVN